MVNWQKVRTYVVPSEMNDGTLKALVSGNVPQIHQRFDGYSDGIKSPELIWQNIKDFIEYGENYNDVDLEKTDYLEVLTHPDLEKKQAEQNTVITKD